jgi:predicted nucleic acid-binding protein
MMPVDKRIFLDTNVLLAVTDEDREHHREALTLLDEGLSGGLSLFVNGQVLREYLVVATRPIGENGLGMSVQDAVENIRSLSRCLMVLGEDSETATCLSQLVSEFELKGKRIHDANLVATMRLNGLWRLKTFNPADFRVFADLRLE